MSMTAEQQQEFLASLGLKKDAAANGPVNLRHNAVLAPEGVDPHTMKVSDIVFDPALLDGFPSLDGPGMNEASRHVFALYKSAGRDKDRNGLLHRRISEFISQVRLSRRTEGVVKPVTEKIKTTKEERDLAKMLAGAGITVEDLAALIKSKG